MADFTDIIQEINTNLPDNNTQSITAAKLRETLIDLTEKIDDVQDDFETNVTDSLSNFVVDSLDSNDTDKALSANNGQELKNRSTLISLTGSANTLQDGIIYCYANHKYRVYLDHTDINLEGITYTTSAYLILGIQNLDENGENAVALFSRGCDDKTSAFLPYYDVTATQNGYLRIRFRAAVGEEVKFFVQDITDLKDVYNITDSLQSQQNTTIAAISTTVNTSIVPTETTGSRLQYQEVGKTIQECMVNSTVFKIQKFEILPNKTYLFSGRYINISGYIKPVCWADENDVIVKVEEQLTWEVTSTHTFIDEDIVAPSNAKYLYINFQTAQSSYYNLKEYSPISSSTLSNDLDSAETDIDNIQEMLEPYTEIVIGTNLINKDDLLSGYLISGGQLNPDSYGKLSNKIYLVPGQTYTIQGVIAYGNHPWVFIGMFDENDNFLDRFGIIVSSSLATQTFKFSDGASNTYQLSIPENYSYCRIQVQTSSLNFNPDIAQLEIGSEATPVVPYEEHYELIIRSANAVTYVEQTLTDSEKLTARTNIDSAEKKKIRLISIGNSYSQDTLSYVPYLMSKIAPDIDLTIGICMLSSSYLSQHYGNFNTSYATYTFYVSEHGNAWENKGTKSIEWALDNYDWDIVMLQQSSGYSYQDYDTYYQPFLDQLVTSISNYLDYNVKFGWLLTQSRPASVNSGANWDDATILSHYNSIASNSQKVYDETMCDFVIPAGTAIQNARTIESIEALGAYSTVSANTSGKGYLCYSDGVHLQEGLGCHISALTTICKLLEMSGYDYESVIGEGTLITSSLISQINVPGPHGGSSPIGETDSNVRIGEMCAVMACKNPYEVTDMNVYTTITKVVFVKDYSSHITNTTSPYIMNYGNSLTLTLSAAENYIVSTVNVYMGNTEITSSVYNSETHQILIPEVTDCVLVKARTTTA